MLAWPAPMTSCSLSARLRKPLMPPCWRSVPKRLEAAGEQLVAVGLVADVPEDPVARRLELRVEGHVSSTVPEAGAQVAAGLGDRVDDRLAHLGRERVELGVEATQVGGGAQRRQAGYRVRGARGIRRDVRGPRTPAGPEGSKPGRPSAPGAAGCSRSGRRRRGPEVPAEEVQDQLHPHDAVRRRAGPAQLVALGREAHQLDLAAEHPQGAEEVDGLVDRAAQVPLRVQDQERGRDPLREGERRHPPVEVRVLERGRAELVPEERAEVRGPHNDTRSLAERSETAALKRSLWATIHVVM